MTDIITDENDIFFWFEMIRQVKPESVLDYGMFLRSIGALTRGVKDMRIPDTVRLTGVDPEHTAYLDIYDTVYDSIISHDAWISSSGRHTLALVMDPDTFLGKDPSGELFKKLSLNVEHVGLKLSQPSDADRLCDMVKCRIKPVTLDKNSYTFISFEA